jgi:hypothetical protein
MTTITKIMYYIEFHHNIQIIEAISHPSFDPNGELRVTSLLTQCVKFNNFEGFKPIILHPKLNFSKITDHGYLYTILERMKCDIPENRRYLQLLFDNNYEFNISNLYVLNYELFTELFDKVDKSNFSKVKELNSFISDNFDIRIFNDVSVYLKNNFPQLFNQQFIESNYLKSIFKNDFITFLTTIDNLGFNIDKIFNTHSPYYYFEKFMNLKYTYNNKTVVNRSKCLQYLVNKNITYDLDILKTNNLPTLVPVNNEWYCDDIRIYFLNAILENYDNLKKIYLKFNETPSDILVRIFSDLIHSRMNFSYKSQQDRAFILNELEILMEKLYQKINFINPITIITDSYVKTFKNLYGEINWPILKRIVLRLINKGCELSLEQQKFLKDKLNIFGLNDDILKDAKKFCEDNPIIDKKETKKKKNYDIVL